MILHLLHKSNHSNDTLKPMKKRFLMLAFWAFLVFPVTAQMSIRVVGTPSFDTASLFVSEAGNDFQSEVTESMPSTTLHITDTGKSNRDYVVYATLAQPQGSIILEVKRLNDGTTPTGGQATGRISGGKEYIRLSAFPVPFFECKGDRINVLLGFALRNLSVTQPAGDLQFQVLFTAYPK